MSLPPSFDRFKQIICLDFEFQAPAGEPPSPVCVVAIDARSGEITRDFFDDHPGQPPYPIGPDSLVVAYFASAEMSCHIALKWACPVNLLDLFCEFRCLTNSGSRRVPASLLEALRWYGLDSIGLNEKEGMRELALRGGPFTQDEKLALLDYCESDVRALVKLLPIMAPTLDIDRALIRGRYMASVALMESYGIPIDQANFELLKTNWESIQDELIARVDKKFSVFEGRSFRQKQFLEFLKKQDIRWPRLPSGKLDLRDQTFKDMAGVHPQINSLRELRTTLSKMRLSNLPVGIDGRNRCLLSPFSSKTSRNQPSNSRFIFGPSVWMRALIKPSSGKALAYIDWDQQEFGIGGALSGDKAMMEAYASGDPYLTFAKQSGAVPDSATKLTHPAEREQFKIVALAVQYGMGVKALAMKLNKPSTYGHALLNLHKRTYSRFWQWQEGVIRGARFNKSVSTVFGWRVKVDSSTGDRTIANFPIQGNGAEMLRLAVNFALAKGIIVNCPVHDALLIEADDSIINDAVEITQSCMEEASKIVLNGFPLRSGVEIVRYPGRYQDPRGEHTWKLVSSIVEGLHADRCASEADLFTPVQSI